MPFVPAEPPRVVVPTPLLKVPVFARMPPLIVITPVKEDEAPERVRVPVPTLVTPSVNAPPF